MGAPLVILLMGPTASGKTDLAVALHELLSVELVSVDAAQVYRGLDIGTGKPSPALRERAPHHLLDLCWPEEAYSVAQFCADARRVVALLLAAGKVPLLVGGTMFYFHALEFGLSDLPEGDEAVRGRLALEAERDGWQALHRRLEAVDPAAARRIQPQDRQRLQRALELMALTGQTPSALRERPRQGGLPYRLLRIAIAPRERALLHERVEQRFRGMLAAGLVEETERLWERTRMRPEAPARRIVGYRQVGEYLSGTIHYNDMIARSLAATRQLAKRQWTWLRSYPGLHEFDSDDSELLEKAADLIRQNLAAAGAHGLNIER